jgi:hypothetical protein
MEPRRFRLLLKLLIGAVVVVALSSRVRDVRSDPRATLVATQVLLAHGTLAMDSLGPERLRDYGYVFGEHGGHYYSRFPLGTSLLATPFVFVARLLGLDLREYENERLLQVLLVALVAAADVALLVRLARFWLAPGWALAAAAVVWFGSSLASTQVTALWSHDFATLLALVALVLGLGAARERAPVPALAIAFALLFAYLCRPTFSVFAVALLAYLFAHDRRGALKAAGLLVVGLGLFVAVCWFALGQPLPDYYLPQRLRGSHYLTALVGNLVSPSRGLFVYSPVVLLPLVFLRATVRGFAREKSLLFVAVAWPLAHLLLVSRLRHWWAGYSFGPRFLTDVIPGLFVLLCVALRASLERRPRVTALVFALLGAGSCAINTVQGLYNRAPKYWNAAPNIDTHPELVFDWSYPQFLHTDARQRARLAALGIAPNVPAGR